MKSDPPYVIKGKKSFHVVEQDLSACNQKVTIFKYVKNSLKLTFFKAVVGGPAMAGPLFLPKMVLAGPHFWPNIFFAGPFSHVSSRPFLMICFSMIKDYY